MSKKKITIGFYCPQEIANAFLKIIGYGENSSKSKGDCFIEYVEKLLLDKSSPAPNSPSGEQKPQTNKTPEQILYDQYLKDTSEIDFSKIPKTETPKPQSPFDFIEQHPCLDRAIVKEKDGTFVIYCQGKKIPIEVCVTQQKKAIELGWKRCYPPFSKPPQKKWQQRTQQDQEPRSKLYKDNDGYIDPFVDH